MQDEIVEGETVEKRLQRRAGRTRPGGEVDLPCPAPIVGAAEIGEYISRSVFDDDDGEAAAVFEIGALAFGPARDCILQRSVQRRDDARIVRMCALKALG